MSDIGEDIPFKFIGNNVNKKGVPTLITSEMMHMFSVMAVRNHVPFPSDFLNPARLLTLSYSSHHPLPCIWEGWSTYPRITIHSSCIHKLLQVCHCSVTPIIHSSSTYVPSISIPSKREEHILYRYAHENEAKGPMDIKKLGKVQEWDCHVNQSLGMISIAMGLYLNRNQVETTLLVSSTTWR